MDLSNNTFSPITLPGLGAIPPDSGFHILTASSDGHFRAGENGVIVILATGDRKVEFIAFHDHTLAYIKSELGYPAYYPVHPTSLQKPIRAVLMDLDGTTVHSERFWMEMIQKTIASLLGNPRFELETGDLPYVSGHSVSEHLTYCIQKYCPGKTLETARELYFHHTRQEMQFILEGRGRHEAFNPAPGLKEFLLELKALKIKIALVTSGLYEKAYPQILAAFQTLAMGDPRDFYDCIITGGFPLRQGAVGTLGELSPKPHPWLYAEAGRVGIGIPFEDRHSVLGIEDSGAGACAVRLAGYPVFGIAGGNILESGTGFLCDQFCETFAEILSILR
ncbi:MAG TPA: HAD family phosphatase [Bacillota bacterium]|nr:HAD family phosphatase [Bacillota bacterium]